MSAGGLGAQPDQRMDAPRDQLGQQVQQMQRTLRRLTVLTGLLCLAVFLLAASVYGYLVNYFSFEAILVGGVAVGCAVLGFLFGLMVGRR